MRRLLIAATFAALLIACSGGDKGSRVLHFTGRDETEANFRDRVRQVIRLPDVKTAMCLPLVGKSPEAAHELLKPDEDDYDPNDVPTGATPRPGQKGVRTDLIRAAGIVLEECKR